MSKKDILKIKVIVKVIDLSAIGKGIVCVLCVRYEVSVSYGSKLEQKVQVDKRQTGQNQFVPDLSKLGLKNAIVCFRFFNDPSSYLMLLMVM